jgi:hypothetical protein
MQTFFVVVAGYVSYRIEIRGLVGEQLGRRDNPQKKCATSHHCSPQIPQE